MSLKKPTSVKKVAEKTTTKKASKAPAAPAEEEVQPTAEEVSVQEAEAQGQAQEETHQETASEVVLPEEVEVVETAAAKTTQAVAEVEKTASSTAIAASPSPAALAPSGSFEGDEEFGALDIRFGSFPILKIDGSSFELDNEELDGESLTVVITQARAKYIFKEADVKETDNFVYSYDGIEDTNGVPVATFEAKMKAKGIRVERKDYLEAVAEILDDGDFEGDFVLLSIPPSSVSRFSGYRVKLMHKYKLTPKSVITEISVGKKLKSGANSWHPWKFVFKGKYAE